MPKGRYAGSLSEGSRRNEKVLLHFLHGSDKAPGSDDITQPPACHGVEFRKPVENEGLFGEFQYAVLRRVVDQPMVDLVGNHGHPHIGDSFQDPLIQDCTRRVSRRIDDYGSCIGTCSAGHILEIRQIPVAGGHW